MEEARLGIDRHSHIKLPVIAADGVGSWKPNYRWIQVGGKIQTPIIGPGWPTNAERIVRRPCQRQQRFRQEYPNGR